MLGALGGNPGKSCVLKRMPRVPAFVTVFPVIARLTLLPPTKTAVPLVALPSILFFANDESTVPRITARAPRLGGYGFPLMRSTTFPKFLLAATWSCAAAASAIA